MVFVGFFLITGIGNIVFPLLTTSHQDKITADLAAQFSQKLTPPPDKSKDKTADKSGQDKNSDKSSKKKGKKPQQSQQNNQSSPAPAKPAFPEQDYFLERINENHLSWFYLTDKKGKIVSQTKPFAPDQTTYEESSRKFNWRGQDYYESVAPVNGAYNLHAGFYTGPPVGLNHNMLDEEMPLVLVLLLLGMAVLGVVALYLVSVTLPTGRLIAHCKRRDGDGLTPGRLSMQGASKEILDLQQLVESKYSILEAKESAIKEKDSAIKQATARYDHEMAAAKKEKTALFLKDAENQFLERLSDSLDSETSLPGVAETLLNSLNSEFPSSFEFALFFSINKKKEALLISHLGFQNNPIEVYKGLGLMKGLHETESENCEVVETHQIVQSQFKEITQLTGARCLVMAPLVFQSRRLALMVVFFRGQDQALEHIMRVLNRCGNISAKALHHIVTYEEQVEASRTDELTGFPNKAYLPHLLPQLVGQAQSGSEKRPFSVFLVEGHDVLAINEKYGRPAGDAVIQELGKRIDNLLQQRRTETMGSWGDHLIRYQGAQFLVILRQVDAKKAVIFAQRLRQVVEESDYPHGVGHWSVAIGISTFPDDSVNPDELIMNVDTALSFARGQSERNKIAHINGVPKAFRSAKLASNLGGTLDVFDPAALLQSLSISRKSGILTVTHPEGKLFWCFLENGKPTKARMGKFTGPAAIIEFLVLFESGEFSFTDLSQVEKQTLDDISKLPKTFDVPGSLERCLMDGALARDHFSSAKNVIKETTLFVWPQPAAKNGSGFQKLKELKDPPSPDEEKAMRDMIALANGKVPLKQIFERLDTTPTHALWRGAAILVEHDLIQLKKLATSIAL